MSLFAANFFREILTENASLSLVLTTDFAFFTFFIHRDLNLSLILLVFSSGNTCINDSLFRRFN